MPLSADIDPEKKILIVDDDQSIGTLIADFLHSEGYKPYTFSNPQEALEFSRNNPFPLAFVDINMPEMSGLELAAKLKEELPLSEVIFITGYGSFDNAIQAIKIGAYDYLRKPFGLSELKLCLKRFQERQELKHKIIFAEQKYYQLVQNIPSLVFIIKKDFSVEFINTACESLLGYKPEEAVYEPEWMINRIHKMDQQRIKRLFLEAFNSRNSRFSTECRLVHRDGHSLYVMLGTITSAESEMTSNGEVEKIQGMIVDITDRVFLEKAVIQREKLKILSSISAEVAHGIRNPLVSIGGFARRLRKRFSELPEGDIILSESERLERMLERLAEYLKPVEVNLQDVSVNDVLTNCIRQLTSEIEDKELDCHMKLDPSLSLVSADSELLGRTFQDLIQNAINETENGGEINVTTFESENNLHIEFKNSCPKTRIKDPEPFFMPFNSGDQEVGLSLSYRLLKNMGGLLSFSHGDKEMAFTVSLSKNPSPSSEIDGVSPVN